MNDAERKVRRMLWGHTWFLVTEPDDDDAIPRDQGGFIMTHAQWDEMREKIDAFYAEMPAGAIDEYNDGLMRKHGFGKYQGMPKERKEPQPPPPKLPKPGYIYLLHGEGTTWYKIGISIKPAERRYSLGTNAPFPITTVSYYDVEDMHGVEAWWHETFAHKRKHGEWFELDEYDILLFDAQEGRPIL